MNFKTNIPTLIYILRMTGFVHHVFINKKTQECENKKLRKLIKTQEYRDCVRFRFLNISRNPEKFRKIPKNRLINLSIHTYS
jgi:hypothetical protein